VSQPQLLKGPNVANQLIPPPELAPPVPENLTPEQCVDLWLGQLDLGEQLLLAGLRQQVGPAGDVMAAYRQWRDEQRQEHDRMIRHMLAELGRRQELRPAPDDVVQYTS
jgi:hypothetical protein